MTQATKDTIQQLADLINSFDKDALRLILITLIALLILLSIIL